jgi:hypothetical protein
MFHFSLQMAWEVEQRKGQDKIKMTEILLWHTVLKTVLKYISESVNQNQITKF